MGTFITPIKPMSMTDFFNAQAEQLPAGSSFGKILDNAISNVEQAEKKSQQGSFDLAMGNVEDLAQIQIDGMKMQTMIQTTVQFASRAVNTYKEVMQMQI